MKQSTSIPLLTTIKPLQTLMSNWALVQAQLLEKEQIVTPT